jgi:HNH endonuclease
MTIKRAERMTGYEIRKLPDERGRVTFGAFNDGELIAKASGRVEWIALRTVVEIVYKQHIRIAMQRAGWRCTRCRSSRPLQPHHRKYRSHGGTHRIDNLEPVCWDCHRIIHQLEHSQ